jgi:hypothetical protein
VKETGMWVSLVESVWDMLAPLAWLYILRRNPLGADAHIGPTG